MSEFRLPEPCMDEPHVHVHALRHRAVIRVGHDSDGANGYGERMTFRWHGIDPWPVDYSAYIGLDPVIQRRLDRYVAVAP